MVKPAPTSKSSGQAGLFVSNHVAVAICGPQNGGLRETPQEDLLVSGPMAELVHKTTALEHLNSGLFLGFFILFYFIYYVWLRHHELIDCRLMVL